MEWYIQFFYISKIKRYENFSIGASKTRLIFYISFSLRLIENLHEQKYFLERWPSCVVYNNFI